MLAENKSGHTKVYHICIAHLMGKKITKKFDEKNMEFKMSLKSALDSILTRFWVNIKPYQIEHRGI